MYDLEDVSILSVGEMVTYEEIQEQIKHIRKYAKSKESSKEGHKDKGGEDFYESTN